MKFFSSHTLANTQQPSAPPTILMMNLRSKIPTPINQVTTVPNIIVPTPIPSEKKIKWGEPTWFLFHTLSVKIRDYEFPIIRQELLNQIYAICINLPCPDCANHAKIYLDGINFNTIQTKHDLKWLLWSFHNSVNQRKGYAIFPFDEVDEKYSVAITKNIIQNFMVHFSDRNRSLKLLPTDLHRQRLCFNLKIWFNDNIARFEP
jgi:hypothetical protein